MSEFLKSNPNMGRIILCKGCNQEKEHHGKGMCFNCYRKYVWNPPKIICPNCKKQRPHKAKGLCASCHMKIYHYDCVKASNYRKYHNISLDLYRELTKECIICGFNSMVDLHHLDKDNKNNNLKNLIGLCSNHHKMLHDQRFSKQIKEELKKRGIIY